MEWLRDWGVTEVTFLSHQHLPPFNTRLLRHALAAAGPELQNACPASLENREMYKGRDTELFHWKISTMSAFSTLEHWIHMLFSQTHNAYRLCVSSGVRNLWHKVTQLLKHSVKLLAMSDTCWTKKRLLKTKNLATCIRGAPLFITSGHSSMTSQAAIVKWIGSVFTCASDTSHDDGIPQGVLQGAQCKFPP